MEEAEPRLGWPPWPDDTLRIALPGTALWEALWLVFARGIQAIGDAVSLISDCAEKGRTLTARAFV
jgi:hypothetical protein